MSVLSTEYPYAKRKTRKKKNNKILFVSFVFTWFFLVMFMYVVWMWQQFKGQHMAKTIYKLICRKKRRKKATNIRKCSIIQWISCEMRDDDVGGNQPKISLRNRRNLYKRICAEMWYVCNGSHFMLLCLYRYERTNKKKKNINKNVFLWYVWFHFYFFNFFDSVYGLLFSLFFTHSHNNTQIIYVCMHCCANSFSRLTWIGGRYLRGFIATKRKCYA